MTTFEIPTITPLFYDALSGEFTVDNKQHTLGRLAVATFMKGERSNNSDSEFSLVYTPSWAQGVDVTIHAERDLNTARLRSLDLRLKGQSGDAAGLSITDILRMYRQPGEARVSGFGEDTMHFHSLALGKDLNETRAHITESAQSFFADASSMA